MRLNFETFLWPGGIEEKVEVKHGLRRDDVEDAFFDARGFVRRGRGLYYLYSQTPGGTYVFVAFVRDGRTATVVTAREMTTNERRLYRRR